MQAGNIVYSHQGKRLEQHLLHTAALAASIAEHFGVPWDQNQEKSIILHDLAKAHPAFQRHLLEHKGRFGHAEPSAVLAFGLTGDFLCAEAIRKHHAQLDDLERAKRFWSCWDYGKKVKEVIDRIPLWDGAQQIEGKIGKRIESWKQLLPTSKDWDELIFDNVTLFEPGERPELSWLRLRIFYSLLVTADRYDAAVGDHLAYLPLRISLNKVTQFAASLRERPLAEWREQVRREVVDSARKKIIKPGVYTLTLPTGAGKTLIGLNVAMEAAQRFDTTGIIYVLPFVSLVEQNADVARKLFEGISPVREDHYLSGITVNDDRSNPSPLERFLKFFRYWQEPVVVTTMAKLWEVLYSPHGNDTMSFHRLSKAVVVLDEPQTIPPNYWDGFGKTMYLLNEKMGTTFILMTATQPEIVRGNELAAHSYSFPMVRHHFSWCRNELKISDLVEHLWQSGVADKSSLLVFNTRKSALLALAELRLRGVSPYFLSGWVTPADRRAIMQKVKADEEAKQLRRLVSTQVVEAGVDLDFEMAFRDLAPIDSIIQVAGRCNRNGRYRQGEVLIAELKDANGRSYAGYVYDSNLLVATKNVLREKFDEKDCPEIIAAYYRKVSEITPSDQIWNDIKDGRWGERHDLFPDEWRDEQLLVIDYNGADADLALLNQKPQGESDFMKLVERKRAAFKRIGLHAVNVSKKALEEWSLRLGGMILDEERGPLTEVLPGIWLVSGEGIERIYSHSIGFIPLEMESLLGDNE